MTELQKQSLNLSNKLSKLLLLEGYFVLNFYTGNLTVNGIYLPDGLCQCTKYNRTIDDNVQFDLEWKGFSDHTQKNILLEVSKKYLEH